MSGYRGGVTVSELKEENDILHKYKDRIFNKDASKVLSGEELHEAGLKYLHKKQEERNNNSIK